MSNLKLNPFLALSFQRQILGSLLPDKDLEEKTDKSQLIVIARGLGLLRIAAALLKCYDDPQNLIIVLGATPEQERGLGEILGSMGVRKPGLRVVKFTTLARQREDLYKTGGLLAISSQILVVDMLNKVIPTELITGVVVLNAERVTLTSSEAFILRIYKQANSAGFVKAFSCSPENFTMEMNQLQKIVRHLHVKEVSFFPRFHEQVKRDLGTRKADVVELYQPMTASMREIQVSIVECMEATLSEVRRSNSSLEIDDLTVENALFRSFDQIVRRQLDSVWHKVGPKTKQLVNDLSTLRSLLTYLLTYDAVTFNMLLENIIATNSTQRYTTNHHQSPWLYLDAANVIFSAARNRAYRYDKLKALEAKQARESEPDQDEWDALNETEAGGTGGAESISNHTRPYRKTWPPGYTPILEELPKWGLLGDVLEEIESDIQYNPQKSGTPGSSLTLVMCGSERTADQLRDFLTHDSGDVMKGGKKVMTKLLKSHLRWKAKLGNMSKNIRQSAEKSGTKISQSGDGPGSKRNSDSSRGSASKRRRVRGGSVTASLSAPSHAQNHTAPSSANDLTDLEVEATGVADFLQASQNLNSEYSERDSEDDGLQIMELDDDEDDLRIVESSEIQTGGLEIIDGFDVISAEDLIVIKAYQGEDDDEVLKELNPRYIIMYDADASFVRRIEVYRSSNPGLSVRVYFMMYIDSVDEQKYLSGLRREKDAFERLIGEKSNMLIPLHTGETQLAHSVLVSSYSSRNAGGGKNMEKDPMRVIVDMREFKSNLPSMLHSLDVQVIPVTLAVGDYILSPSICVERKAIPDLISSFISGRLYTQCESMSVHYKTPVLLIEFEENKSFSLQSFVSVQRITSKGPQNSAQKKIAPDLREMDMQAKLVLLCLTFPRLRIIWSSSPHATVEIFKDLKKLQEEPDPFRAMSIGSEGSGMNSVWNITPQDVIRSLPGVTSKNYKYIMGKVESLKAMSALSLSELKDIMGSDPGKLCYNFLHKDISKR